MDNGPSERNSYYWGRQQCVLLTTNDVDYFTSTDYRLARMRHWLGYTVHGDARSMDTLSVERLASPDGVTEGQKSWFDYLNKGGYGPPDQGDHIQPDVIARVLPDGSTGYTWFRRNEWQLPTNIVETYTTEYDTIGLRTNTFLYAGNGIDLLQHIGPNGEQVISNYFGNAYHQVDASYDALNQETRYTYNANRQLTSVQQPTGLTITNIFYSSGDEVNRLAKRIDLEITRTNSYTYYTDGQVYSHTDERGLTTTNFWDNLQRLTGVKYPDGTTVSNVYTTLDLTATKDRLGNWSYFGFNGVRQRTFESNPNGVTNAYGYCECGALSSVTNAWNTSDQMVTSFNYDYQGNRLYAVHPDSTETNWYDSLRRLTVSADERGYRWYFYNNQGLLLLVANSYGTEQSIVYDVEDRPVYVTDANDVTVTNTYDDLGRLRTRGYPDGGVEKFGYSARGLIAYTNQLSFTNFYAYDEAGRKTFETNANWEVIRYTNNAAGDLLSLTDGKNQTSRWQYDEYGRVTNKVDQAGSGVLRYSYDSGNRLTNRWSAAKGTTTYRYDPVGNLTNVDYPAGTADVTFGYDALNRVTNMVDGVGTTKYTYTGGGQLWTEDGPWANDTITNLYVNRMRRDLNLQQPAGLWTNRFIYDDAGRLTNVTSGAGSFSYTLAATSPGSAQIKKLLLPNTSYITNTYDAMAQLTGTYLKNSSHTTLDKDEYVSGRSKGTGSGRKWSLLDES